MKTGLMLLFVIAASGPATGQERALPFAAGDLGPNQQNQPTTVVVEGDLALIGRPDSAGISAEVYRRDGSGMWQFEDLLETGALRDMTLNPAVAEAVTVIGGEVRFHKPSFLPNWVFFGSSAGITLPAGEVANRVALDGDVAAVLAEETIDLNNDQRVRIYERVSGTWSEVAMREIPAGGIFGGTAVISDMALRGTRLALGVSLRGEVRIYERDQGGAGNWGEVATIDGEAAGFTDFGEVVILDGERLATVARDGSGTSQVEVFGRNAGGADRWGSLGTAFAASAGITGLLLDADDGRLLVLGLPDGGGLLFANEPAEAWWFGPGSGPTGWVEERHRTVGAVRGAFAFRFNFQIPRWASISGEETLFGLADEAYEGAAAWAVSAHRRSAGGAAGWGLTQVIDGNGVADGFGRSVAFHGGVLAVGMPDDSWSGGGSGSVMLWWVYMSGRGEGQTLLPLGRLESPSPQIGELFGTSVAVHVGGGTARFPDEILVAVGAPGRDGGRGAAYVFEVDLSGTSEGIALTPAGGLDVDDSYGSSVAALGGDGAMVAVGAPGDDASATNAGAVYLFERDLGGDDNWGQRAKRGRPVGLIGSDFGRKVALADPTSGRALLATRPPMPGSPGQVVIFRRNQGGTDAWGWAGLIDPPAEAPPGFAAGLDSDGGIAVVGATGDFGGIGEAYVYVVADGSLSPILKIRGSLADGPSFGEEVAVSLLHVAVGAPEAGGGDGRLTVHGRTGPGSGDFGLLFTRNGSGGEKLGRAVGTYGIYSAAGAPDSDAWGTGSGRVLLDRAGSYEIWAKSQGPSMLPDWRPNQDADGDGQGNLIEFALGGDPTDPASRGVLRLERGIYRPTTDADPAMIWEEPALPYFHELLDWRMDASPDLASWSLERFLRSGNERFYLIPTVGGERRFYRLEPYYPWPGTPQGQSGGGGVILLGE